MNVHAPIASHPISLSPGDPFTRSIFDGVTSKEFTAQLLGAWADESGNGCYGAMLKLTPVKTANGNAPAAPARPDQAVAAIAQALQQAMPQKKTLTQQVLADLIADAATQDVAEHLIKPLLARDPPLLFEEGRVREELCRTALRFKPYAKRKLAFAAAHLLKGKHANWPDPEEFFAALGRYDAFLHGRADEDAVSQEKAAAGA